MAFLCREEDSGGGERVWVGGWRRERKGSGLNGSARATCGGCDEKLEEGSEGSRHPVPARARRRYLRNRRH
eukprot:749635-Hanusia_phi.AAC.3